MVTDKEYKAVIGAVSGECERLHKENEELKKELKKALENHDTFMKYAYSYGKADALSQEPCDDAVSRDAVIKLFNGNIGSEAALILHKVKQLPSVTQKSGKWISIVTEHKCYARDDTYTTTEYKCSECGAEPLALCANDESDYAFSNFCPNCGARMESEDKE